MPDHPFSGTWYQIDLYSNGVLAGFEGVSFERDGVHYYYCFFDDRRSLECLFHVLLYTIYQYLNPCCHTAIWTHLSSYSRNTFGFTANNFHQKKLRSHRGNRISPTSCLTRYFEDACLHFVSSPGRFPRYSSFACLLFWMIRSPAAGLGGTSFWFHFSGTCTCDRKKNQIP